MDANNSMDLAGIVESLDRDGYVYIPPVRAGFDYQGEVARLGPLLPQYAGEIVRDVKPRPGFRNDETSPYNTADLRPHTEWYEFPGLPPRYVALWSVYAARGPGGETTLADGYDFLTSFSDCDKKSLFLNAYEWKTNPIRTPERVEQGAHRPALQRHGERVVLRFSTLDLRVGDELSARYVSEGLSFFERNHVSIKIETDALLIWDNWRMFHSRTAFEDSRRHLRRVLVSAED